MNDKLHYYVINLRSNPEPIVCDYINHTPGGVFYRISPDERQYDPTVVEVFIAYVHISCIVTRKIHHQQKPIGEAV